jgi:hypothetical protein
MPGCLTGQWACVSPSSDFEEEEQTCDGLDNDCDGQIDDVPGRGDICRAGLGVCEREGILVCDVDVGDLRCSATTGTPEIEACNGLDDDCNGIDDDVIGSGMPCEAGMGLCQSAGEMRCDLATRRLACSAQPRQPAAEVCDARDNDCDGTADEGLVNACGGCGPVPVEVCNQQDEDCDGRVDEGTQNACGRCGAAPVEQCNGQDEDCDGQADEGVANACGDCGPLPIEACNRIDDDCDGQLDEGVVNACGDCGPVPAEVCNGLDEDCDGRVDEGTRNACGGCGALPEETCNGVDEDCDGRVDEGLVRACFEGPAGTENVGICRGGRSACVGGAYGACEGQIVPGDEACNEADDDCDGRQDEGFAVGEACEVGLGQCERPGRMGCEAGDLVCQGQAAPPAPTDARCDGLDEDCDGRLDENFVSPEARCGVGACAVRSTSARCLGGRVAPCVPGAPQVEVCDGIDDDCDGQTDEGVLNRCGVCGPEPQEVCNDRDDDCDGQADERLTNRCGECGPEPAEQCNGIDDDCDGAIDEQLRRACRTACGDGEEQCQAGQWVGCNAPAPIAEICNARDDDCDQRTDEGVLNACGVCGNVPVEQCNGRDDDCDGRNDEGTLNRCGACGVEPAEVCNRVDDDCDQRTDEGVANRCGGCGLEPEEICNGADDDCDGRLDEALFRACNTVCGAGREQCVQGRYGQCDAPQPVAEQCNSRDDDCDGRNDEGTLNRCGQCGPEPQEVCNGRDDDCDARFDEGTLNRCGQCGPEPQEICNGRDDDCDGRFDEGTLNRCGQCGPEPQEICNGRDEDCDGRNDEGTLNACGQCGAVPAETCNNRDDDCDGRNDEGGNLCGGGDLCVRGACCDDNDGDGHAAIGCGGTDCDDNDRYKHPGRNEVHDVRDNDCNGEADDLGLVRWNRYYRAWSNVDWEHRFAQARPANFEAENPQHYVMLFPDGVCNGPRRPDDTCVPERAPNDPRSAPDAVIRLTHGTMVALSQCTGILGQHHVSLSLGEDSGEYQGYRDENPRRLVCTRMGYVYGGGTWRNVAGGVAQFYRHRSGFNAAGRGDNMWSTEPREGDPLYDVHDLSWTAKDGF